MPATSARTPAVTVVRATLVAVVAVLLAACDVRLETPPPAPPTPDAAETVRQRTVADAQELQALAGAVAHPEPAVQLLVDAVAEGAAAHVEALGGVYDPGTDGTDEPAPSAVPGGTDADAGADQETAAADSSPDATETAGSGTGEGGTDAAVPEQPGDGDAALGRLLRALETTAATALTDADDVADGTVARLLGSVAVHRLLLSERLTVATAGAAAERAEPWRVAPPDAAGPPAGVPASDALALVTAEDRAGQVWEVVAARREGDARTAAAERAAAHRARAQAWAVATDVAGSGLDPRRTGYALPAGLLTGDTAAATRDVADLETTLADAYLALVARAEPGERAALVAAAADAAGAAAALTAQVPVLPGMPEHAG
ncbi:MAG: DUF4439 domain-containing protein [Actinotalea sp.]|nr:DUF4439 domain-containing protein [Actinotalea sp.]